VRLEAVEGGDLLVVATRLVVDRQTRGRSGHPLYGHGRAVRRRDHRGRAAWPTPRGEFYVHLERYGSPAYGPLAFGTSARS
jgi:hypothetical protein